MPDPRVVKKPLGAWACDNCGALEHEEREVKCWSCGKGQMRFVLSLEQAMCNVAQNMTPKFTVTYVDKRPQIEPGKIKLNGNFCPVCLSAPCFYGDCIVK